MWKICEGSKRGGLDANMVKQGESQNKIKTKNGNEVGRMDLFFEVRSVCGGRWWTRGGGTNTDLYVFG